jgi:hypothetical protein
MSDIRTTAGGSDQGLITPDDAPQLVAQQIGDTTVYFRVSAERLKVVNEPELRAVADNGNPFDQAAKIVNQGVQIIGEKVRSLTDTLRPTELEIEISFGFEVKGKTTIVPVLLTGESTATVGLKVTATWKAADQKPGPKPQQSAERAPATQ